MAKLLSGKVTWLVPVWFQIRRKSDKLQSQFELTGVQDINTTFLNELRQANDVCDSRSNCDTINDGNESDCPVSVNSDSSLMILPRVMLETQLLSDQEVDEVAKILIDASKKYGFDGYTLEVFSQLQYGLALMR
jgi:hypothetical protein